MLARTNENVLRSWLMKWRLVLSVFALGLFVLPATQAAPPWQQISLFKRIDADPEKEYRLVDTNGPWMILAVTFVGDEAEREARELVYELRKVHKLTAFTHEMNFDYSGQVEGRGVDQFGDPVKMRYRRSGRFNEVAVMVGEFPTVDDPAAARMLETIKYLRPVCMTGEKGEVSRPLAGLREMQRMIQGKLGDEKKDRGPMGHAFVTTNPLLPPEYFVPNGPDNLVLEINKDVEFSLLDCPGVYSIKVASFNGSTTIDPNKIRAYENGQDVPSRLAEAAMDAHKLTMALRAKGYEAYEYHDRQSSLVTVGSFDSLGNVDAAGGVHVDPQVEMILKTFSADLQLQPGADPSSMGKPKSLAGIPFDIQAMAIEVPQRSISNAYERSTFSRR